MLFPHAAASANLWISLQYSLCSLCCLSLNFPVESFLSSWCWSTLFRFSGWMLFLDSTAHILEVNHQPRCSFLILLCVRTNYCIFWCNPCMPVLYCRALMLVSWVCRPIITSSDTNIVLQGTMHIPWMQRNFQRYLWYPASISHAQGACPLVWCVVIGHILEGWTHRIHTSLDHWADCSVHQMIFDKSLDELCQTNESSAQIILFIKWQKFSCPALSRSTYEARHRFQQRRCSMSSGRGQMGQ